MEKRRMRRNRAQIRVMCSSLTAGSLQPVSEGILLDCSFGGIHIELYERVQVGGIVMIKAIGICTEESSPELPEGFRTFSLAEVKWLKPLKAGSIQAYAVGLKYFSGWTG